MTERRPTNHEITNSAPDILAIIPARGGSKGIPRKNVLPLAGIPLIAHTIKAAIGSSKVTRIVVSTDDSEIAEIARAYDIDVIMRPPALADDHSKSEEALIHTLENLKSTEGYTPELIVFLQCTSPFTLSADIDGTIDTLYSNEADTALVVAPFHFFIWHENDKDGAVGVNHNKSGRLMRQQKEPEYLETGSVYVMKTEAFLEIQHRFFGRTALFEIPQERVLEIDDPYDFVLAEERISKFLSRKDFPVKRVNFKNARGLAMDFDGVHTDDRVLISEDGQEAALCSRLDGMGIELLRLEGMPMVVISKERVNIVEKRCAKLSIPCIYGEDDKLSKLVEWANKNSIALDEVIYIGNDVNDVECLKAVGIGVVPADAHEVALSAANVVLSSMGGKGAIRELADIILRDRYIR